MHLLRKNVDPFSKTIMDDELDQIQRAIRKRPPGRVFITKNSKSFKRFMRGDILLSKEFTVDGSIIYFAMRRIIEKR